MMAKGKPTAVVVGAGRIALSHIPHIIFHSDIELLGIVEPNRLLRFVLSRLFKVPAYSDIKAIAHLDFDAVFILTPPSSHYEITKSLLKLGKHVFLEKPVTLKPEHSQELLELAKENFVQFSCGYVYRYHPIYNEMRSIISNSIYGDAISCKIEMIGNVVNEDAPKTWRNTGRGSGCLYDYGCHAIDMHLFLFGSPSTVNCLSKESIFQEGVVDRFTAEICHDDKCGFKSEIICDWANSQVRKAGLSIEIDTPNTKIHTDGQKITVTGDTSKVYSIKDLQTDVSFYLRGEEFQLQMDSFVFSITENDHNYANIEDGVLCDSIISDLFEATV